jgi:transposase InsO family protein
LKAKDLLLKKKIESVHTDNVWYGHRRIAWSMDIGFKKARRLMKRFAIVAKVRLAKRFIKTKDINNPDAGIPNLTKGRCSILPNVVWRSDFTHIIYHSVHLYLATVIDEYTKEILGYSLSFVHTKEFVLEAIQKAIENAKATPSILHSDQGSEYTSYLVLNFLKEHSIVPSMSKKGSPWENGGQESYYGKLKLELGHPHKYESIEDLIVAIHHQIYYYNYKRIHTTLKIPPKTFRLLFEERKNQFEERKNQEK